MLTYETIYLKASEKCHGNQDDKSHSQSKWKSSKEPKYLQLFLFGMFAIWGHGARCAGMMKEETVKGQKSQQSWAVSKLGNQSLRFRDVKCQ